MIDVQKLADNYNKVWTDRPNILATNGWLVGTWCIGAAYKNPNPLYGAYPHGYLDRVHSIFPLARNILHVFSGGLTRESAELPARVAQRRTFKTSSECCNVRATLVDLHGPEQGRYPTWQGDILDYPEDGEKFDLILADPPYSESDAEKYDVKMPVRSKILRKLHTLSVPGASLVWLDVVWPMHRKGQWRSYGHIGLVRSTNHRMRLVSFFEAQN